MIKKTEIKGLSLATKEPFLVALDTEHERIRIMRGGKFIRLAQVAGALNAALDLLNCAQGTENKERPIIQHLPGCAIYFDMACNCGFAEAIETLSLLSAS